MPATAHEGAVSELREHPDLLSKLVRKLRHAELDPCLKVVDATQRFANPQEVRPDIVYLGERPRWVVVEVQNKIDRTKRRRWLLAASILFNDHHEMGDVIVITASRHVARWAARVASVRSELGTRLQLRPIVLLLAGAAIEALLDPDQPELALLAAWAVRHRHGPKAKETVRRAITLTGKLPAPLLEKRGRAIMNLLNEELAAVVREVMMKSEEETGTPWGDLFFDGLEAEYQARGKAEGKQEALLAVLAARELSLSSEQRQRIQECTEIDVLDHWIRRAATASSADEALEPPPSPRKAAAKPPRKMARRRASRA